MTPVPKPPARPHTAGARPSALKSSTGSAAVKGRTAQLLDSVPIQVAAVAPGPSAAAGPATKNEEGVQVPTPPTAGLAPPKPTATKPGEELLPPGWSKLESRKYPGEFYYMGPNGRPQWGPPNATEGEKKRIKEKLASIYMKDYLKWGSDVETCNPKQLNEGTKASASYALHPRAGKDPKHFVSLKQQDFVPHKVSRPAATSLWPAYTPKPFGSNSTYRADFRPNSARRPKPTRQLTPPRKVAFDHNSINRTDFVDHHPRRPKLVHPKPQLHFTQKAAINSTNRTDFVDHGYGATARSRRPKYFRDPGWVKNWKTGMSNADYVAAAAADGEGEEDSDITLIDPITGRKDLTTMLPVMNGTAEGQFDSTYQTDFVPEDKVVPIAHRRDSKELDRLVVKRVKAHEELRGFE